MLNITYYDILLRYRESFNNVTSMCPKLSGYDKHCIIRSIVIDGLLTEGISEQDLNTARQIMLDITEDFDNGKA